jgi:hypothetical protein
MAARLGPAQNRQMDDLASLRCSFKRACHQRDSAPSFSPDWDAALFEIEQLRTAARLARIARVDLERPAAVWKPRRARS